MAGPLDGVRVLDLTRILAGPYCTMVLADLGADVIKVEQPVSGDPARGNGPFLTADGDGEQHSTYFMSINRGKRSIAIDMGKPEGRELLLRLADRSDVLIENYRYGLVEFLRRHALERSFLNFVFPHPALPAVFFFLFDTAPGVRRLLQRYLEFEIVLFDDGWARHPAFS